MGVAVAGLAGRQPIFKGDFLGGRGGPLFYILFIWGVVVPVRVVQQQQQHNINALIYNINKTIVNKQIGRIGSLIITLFCLL